MGPGDAAKSLEMMATPTLGGQPFSRGISEFSQGKLPA